MPRAASRLLRGAKKDGRRARADKSIIVNMQEKLDADEKRTCVSEHNFPFKRNIGWWAHEGQQPEQEHEVGKAATTQPQQRQQEGEQGSSSSGGGGGSGSSSSSSSSSSSNSS